MHAHVAQRGQGPEALGEVLDPQDVVGHQVRPALRSLARYTLEIIATRIATPRIRSKALALIPIRLKPSCRTPSTSAPTRAPMMVPEPPARAVPPITAAATAKNMIWVPPALGSIEETR